MTERRIEAGLGVVAVVGAGAQAVEVRVGEWALGRNEATDVAAPRPDGKEIFVFIDRAHAATIELAETWREGLNEALAQLRALGVDMEVLTGDANFRPGRPAGQPGIEPGLRLAVRAGLTPAEKLARVRELATAGHVVAFLGDGVNDAAAMSAAPASVAMQTGAELARAAAMAVLAGDDLRFLPRAIRVARAARRSVRTNLLFAAGYNAAGMTLAAAGLLHPVVAALLMVGSSAFVSVRALHSVGPAAGAERAVPAALRTSGV